MIDDLKKDIMDKSVAYIRGDTNIVKNPWESLGDDFCDVQRLRAFADLEMALRHIEDLEGDELEEAYGDYETYAEDLETCRYLARKFIKIENQETYRKYRNVKPGEFWGFIEGHVIAMEISEMMN